MRMFRKAIISAIRLYQKVLSPDQGYLRYLLPIRGACVMHPTCSHYMIEAIEKYGVARGVFWGIRRILRCHPYQKNLIDPV